LHFAPASIDNDGRLLAVDKFGRPRHHKPKRNLLLIDNFGRVHRSIRISVTDRCNIRCFYCMPAGDVTFAPRDALLSFEEIARVVSILAGEGIHDVRLTGGEPLVRRDVSQLVAMIASVPGVADLAMTTNGILLPKYAVALREAGLKRLNISLDTLDEEVFKQITRRDGVERVLAGIDAAIAVGFEQLRLNALAIRGLTENEIESLVCFAAERHLTIRFIEYMPLDADRAWRESNVLSGDEVLGLIKARFGAIRPVAPPTASQPARDYELLDLPKSPQGFHPTVGVIRPVTAPFCGDCDRLRLTAEGTIRNCLFSTDEWDLRKLLRENAVDAEVLECIRDAVDHKRAGHLINRPGFSQPERPMYSIGG
jgi:cyclic pyranopterin phosphate synthase